MQDGLKSSQLDFRVDINPEYSPQAHIGRLPFKDPRDADAFLEGLRKAGLTD
jgi:adenylate cyclase